MLKYFIEENSKLVGNFEFQNFQEALNFINKVGNIAEISNHHPDINLYNYKFVTISSTTHDSGNIITEKDYAIAKLIESSYKK